MRIIGGFARAVRLDAPPGSGVRPTTDRVRESVFGVLGDLRGRAVIDLFAGSGALGLEALSRGADPVVMVENCPAYVRVLRANLARLQDALPPGHQPEAVVLQCDVLRIPQAIPERAGAFDVILADPPYHPRTGGTGPRELLLDTALAAWAGEALLVLQHATRDPLPLAPLSAWRALRQQRYGITTLTYCRCRVSAGP